MRSGRPRYRDYLQTLWCLAFDWIEGLQPLYRHDRRGPLVWVGSKAGVIWFRAHNCRIYNWLDRRPPDADDMMTESEFDSALAAGTPVDIMSDKISFDQAMRKFRSLDPKPTTGPLSHHWECPAGHQRISSTQPLRGGQCYCGEVMVVSAVTS